jgi:hypothetical protein
MSLYRFLKSFRHKKNKKLIYKEQQKQTPIYKEQQKQQYIYDEDISGHIIVNHESINVNSNFMNIHQLQKSLANLKDWFTLNSVNNIQISIFAIDKYKIEKFRYDGNDPQQFNIFNFISNHKCIVDKTKLYVILRLINRTCTNRNSNDKTPIFTCNEVFTIEENHVGFVSVCNDFYDVYYNAIENDSCWAHPEKDIFSDGYYFEYIFTNGIKYTGNMYINQIDYVASKIGNMFGN